MANTLERVTGTATTAGATIYTVPANTTITIIGFRLSNKSTSPVTVQATINGVFITGLDTSIPVSSALDILGGAKIVAKAGDVIAVKASANTSVDVHISFLRQN